MLTGSNDKFLSYKGVNDELIFFYQRWQELLESKTLDMHQYNILNVCAAFDELEGVINKTLAGLFTSKQNVEDVKAEALELLKADNVLIKHNRELRATLFRIASTRIDSKKPDSDEKNSPFYISLNRMYYQLKTPCSILRQQYLSYLLIEVKKAVDSGDKVNIDKLISSLISQCLYSGWSAKGLFMLSNYFLGDLALEDKWNMFVQEISLNHLKDYEVYYSIKVETRQGISSSDVKRIVNDLGINLVKGEEIINLKNPDKQTLYTMIDPSVYYATINVAATDTTAAVLSAINKLNNKFSIATFYNVINPWIASMPQIVIHDYNNKTSLPLKITDVFKTFDYIDSSNNVFDDTKNIINDHNCDDITSKLNSAFSYTNLSRSSIFQETKYITLWIALESVTRTGQYADIISHIKMVLPSTLCLRYFYRLIRNFTEDCIRCGIKKIDSLDINFESLDKKQLVIKTITAFREDSMYADLSTQCQDKNQLLHYRCEEIKKVISDSDNIIKKLEHYKTKVEWHIQRLYRIRNEITHSAFSEDKSLIIFIEHLYSYLAQLICEVVYYIQHKGSKSIEQAYATITDNYFTFIELMKEGRGACDIAKVLPSGIIEHLS